MNSIFSALKRILVVFCAGVLLLISVGCGNQDLQSRAASPATKSEASPMSDRVAPRVPAPRASGTAGTYNNRVGQQTELYDPIQKRQGGMNNFSDVDPRVNTKASDDRATRLMQNARANVNQVNDPKEFTENYREGAPIGERTGNVINRVTEATQNTAEDLAKGTQRGVENLKENLGTAREGFSEGSQQANRNVQDPPKRVTQGTREGVTKAAEELNRNRA